MKLIDTTKKKVMATVLTGALLLTGVGTTTYASEGTVQDAIHRMVFNVVNPLLPGVEEALDKSKDMAVQEIERVLSGFNQEITDAITSYQKEAIAKGERDIQKLKNDKIREIEQMKKDEIKNGKSQLDETRLNKYKEAENEINSAIEKALN